MNSLELIKYWEIKRKLQKKPNQLLNSKIKCAKPSECAQFVQSRFLCFSERASGNEAYSHIHNVASRTKLYEVIESLFSCCAFPFARDFSIYFRAFFFSFFVLIWFNAWRINGVTNIFHKCIRVASYVFCMPNTRKLINFNGVGDVHVHIYRYDGPRVDIDVFFSSFSHYYRIILTNKFT